MNILILISAGLFVFSGLCALGIVRLSALAFAMFGVAAYVLAGTVTLG